MLGIANSEHTDSLSLVHFLRVKLPFRLAGFLTELCPLI